MELVLLTSLCFLLLATVNTNGDDNGIYSEQRREMVENQLVPRGISDSRVIEAMLKIPRHEFLPDYLGDYAYSDGPLPIGMGQTVSQPYIVAYMTELLTLNKGDKVLEIGTGSGYQAAILAEIGCDVYTIEIVEILTLRAKKVLKSLGYKNIHFKVDDGYMGWEENAPYDAILVTAAPPEIPEPLTEQLKEGGKMVIPVGDYIQELILITKKKEGLEEERVTPVRFVPMTGEAQKHHK
jgi:protein-L-isoaspartate(D-aspartate) O-methyltransferase